MKFRTWNDPASVEIFSDQRTAMTESESWCNKQTHKILERGTGILAHTCRWWLHLGWALERLWRWTDHEGSWRQSANSTSNQSSPSSPNSNCSHPGEHARSGTRMALTLKPTQQLKFYIILLRIEKMDANNVRKFATGSGALWSGCDVIVRIGTQLPAMLFVRHWWRK